MSLTDEFHAILDDHYDEPEAQRRAAQLVLSAPATPESSGLLAMLYHDGMGVERDLDRCFELAEQAAFEGCQGIGYFLLGYMCENAETPDQLHGGPRQKYDHYDAERFYTICSEIDSRWSEAAHLWLGHYFMDSARGGDPEIGVEHYEAIGRHNAEAAGCLSEYYWDLLDIENYLESDECDSELEAKVFEWTQIACELDPHDYSYRMGCCYAYGIDCDPENGFRLARKYWEDAYEFGDPDAAQSLAWLYETRLAELKETPGASEAEMTNCEKWIASWRKLAKK